MILLTLLPLAGWAQTANWDPSAPNLKYGDAVPANFGNEVSVVSGNGTSCANLGEGTATPTGNNNQFRWKLSKGGSNVNNPGSLTTLDAGTYTLTLYIRHNAGGC